MGSNLSKSQRKEMIKISNLAEPYPEDSEELNTLDGDPIDGNRALAALAKKILVGEK